ncbi:hypothetical protein HPB52_018320 [Rhipicephalus sanguineus]|uniref:Uncharacterized protein n=1 Tax=Rhipicephalus sanguineus TaxID=34632 RepID=A0A9D4PQR1_RHISA|nr:hypothetical protein HPB52_018320 [Rhipicephalus sanguineus]
MKASLLLYRLCPRLPVAHISTARILSSPQEVPEGPGHWQKTKLEAFARDSCFEVDFEHNPELRIAFCRDRQCGLTPARSAPTVALLAPTHQRPPPSPDDEL